MYCLSNFCYLCLTADKNLLNVSSLDNNKTTILEKLLYTVEDLVLVNSKDTKICKVCCHILRVSHEFKKRCIQNNITFLGYIKQLTEYSNVYAKTAVNVDVNFIPKPKKKPKTINKKRVNTIDLTSTDDDDKSLNDAKTSIINTLIERQIIETLNEPQNVTNSVQNCPQTDTASKTNDTTIIESKINALLKNYTEQIKEKLIEDNTEKILLKNISSENTATQTSDLSDGSYLLFDPEVSNSELQPLFDDEIDAPLIVVKTEPVPTVETQNTLDGTEKQPDFCNFSGQSTTEASFSFLPTVGVQNTLNAPTGKPPSYYNYSGQPSIVYLAQEPIPTVEKQNTLNTVAPTGQPTTVNFAYLAPTVEKQNTLNAPTGKPPPYYNYSGQPTTVYLATEPIPTVEKQNTLNTVAPTGKPPPYYNYSGQPTTVYLATEPIPTVEKQNTLNAPTGKPPPYYNYSGQPTTVYLAQEPIPTVEKQNTLNTGKQPAFYSGQPTTVNFAYLAPTVEKQNTLNVPAPEKEPDLYQNFENYLAHPSTKVSFADYKNWNQRTKVRTVVVPMEHLIQCDVKSEDKTKKRYTQLIDEINTRIQQIDDQLEPNRNILETYLSDPKVDEKQTTSKPDTDLENLILKSNTEYNAKKSLQKEKRRLEQIKELEIKQKLASPTIKDTIINEKISQLIAEPFVKPVETTVDFEAQIGSTKIINEPQMHPILTKLLKRNNQHDITSKLDSDPNIVLQLEHCYNKIPGETTIIDPNTKSTRKRKCISYNPRRKKNKTAQENSANLKYLCHICFQRFGDLHDLNVHVISKHDCKKLFKCEFCPRIYTNLRSLRSHCTTDHKIPCSLTDPEIGNVNTSRNEELSVRTLQQNVNTSRNEELSSRMQHNLILSQNVNTSRNEELSARTVPHSLIVSQNVNTSRNEELSSRTMQHNLRVSQNAAFYKCNMCFKIYSAFKSLQKHFVEEHFVDCSRRDLGMYSEISINELESLNSGAN